MSISVTPLPVAIYMKGWEVVEPNPRIDYNGFVLYRSDNDVATTIEYHWPNSDGTMGELRKMEVVDAAYRKDAGYAIKRLSTLLKSNIGGTNGSGMIDNNKLNHTDPIPSTYTNEAICAQWKKCSIENTAKDNCDIWIANLGGHEQNNNNAIYYARNGITVGGGNWDIPNIFQLIVIFCCSDKLDEMDPTAEDYPIFKLGYTATNGRFSYKDTKHNNSIYGISSTITGINGFSGHDFIGAVKFDGIFTSIYDPNVMKVGIPIHELTVE